MPRIEPLYTLGQCAEIARVPLITLRRYYRAGILPEPKWVSGDKQITRRFTRAEIDRVIDALDKLTDRNALLRAKKKATQRNRSV